jgi:predicted transcriptional regulator
MQPLTDDKLIERLRHIAEENWWADSCAEAADEIERLEKIVEYLAQKIAGPYGIKADEIKAAEEHIWSL